MSRPTRERTLEINDLDLRMKITLSRYRQLSWRNSDSADALWNQYHLLKRRRDELIKLNKHWLLRRSEIRERMERNKANVLQFFHDANQRGAVLNFGHKPTKEHLAYRKRYPKYITIRYS